MPKGKEAPGNLSKLICAQGNGYGQLIKLRGEIAGRDKTHEHSRDYFRALLCWCYLVRAESLGFNAGKMKRLNLA